MVIVVHRFDATDEDESLRAELEALLALFTQRPGFVSGRVARAADEPSAWIVCTEWQGAGSYRRSLSSYDVKMVAPLLGRARPEPSAFEIVARS